MDRLDHELNHSREEYKVEDTEGFSFAMQGFVQAHGTLDAADSHGQLDQFPHRVEQEANGTTWYHILLPGKLESCTTRCEAGGVRLQAKVTRGESVDQSFGFHPTASLDHLLETKDATCEGGRKRTVDHSYHDGVLTVKLGFC
eukprot:TRINITY_DN7263_c0_g1_i3.p2 TRINITY_DN7263_c0_g1~~TRINITY_DN7263_c0_g1_i3.p2  ORF type:complete len:143 (-),score=15.97 TRINITY_DN7263_c0_g1_i3:92-520(-)